MLNWRMYERKKSLARIEHIIPWGERLARRKPHYYKGERRSKL